MDDTKRRVVTWLIVSLVGTTLSCSDTPPKRLRVGLIAINLETVFFNRVNQGAEAEAVRQNIDLIIVNANNDSLSQVHAIENLVKDRVNAIIVLALDPYGILSSITDAATLGIPTIAVDARVAVPPAATFIGVDNFAGGETVGSFLSSYLDARHIDAVTVGIVSALNSPIQIERLNGFVTAVRRDSRIKLSGTVDSQNIQENALAATESMLIVNPDIDVIYATGEPTLVGVVAAVTAQGKMPSVRILGWDLQSQVIRGIDEGFVIGVLEQDPFEEGRQAMQTALELLRGERVAAQLLVPTTLVTRDNVSGFRASH